MASAQTNETIRYESDERCPLFVSVGVAFQGIMLVLAPTVLFVAITVRAAGLDDSYLSWYVFAALIINGVITALQASRLGWFGAGHVVITGPTVLFVVVSATALSQGGPGTLASLILVSSIFQFALAVWLPFLRRIITPVVSGTVLMLITATVLPVAFDRLKEVPETTAPVAGLIVAIATLVVAVALAMITSGAWRLWSPLISIGAGSMVAVLFGMYDVQLVFDAAWIGIPEAKFPGFDLTPGPEFWALLPTFAILPLVLGIKAISDGVIIQQSSQREPRTIDFRRVQGTVSANGVGMVLAGIVGTPPTVVYSSFSISLINFTGVAARSVGYAIGVIFLIMALFPKFTSILLTIPSPVMGAYLLMAMGLFFVGGVRTVVQDGLDQKKTLVVGLAFAIGLGLNSQNIVADVLGETWGSLLGNGVMAGTVVALLLSSLIELTSHRHGRLEVELDIDALPKIDEFLRDLASGVRWNDTSTDRLRSVGEETLSSLLELRDDYDSSNVPRLIITATPGDGTVELEFLAAFDEGNLEDRMAYLSEATGAPDSGEMSLRLLRHYASSVRHRKYHGIDIITVQVEESK